MSTCCLCNKIFCKRKDGKGYQKRPLSTPVHFKHSQLTILEALKLFYNYNGPVDSFICFKCFSSVGKKCRQNHGSPKRKTRVATVSSAARTCRYRRAFRNLLACGPAARKAFNALVRQQVWKEMATFMQQDGFPTFDGSKSIEEFTWLSLVDRFARSLPTLFSALVGSMPPKLCSEDNKPMCV